MLRSTSSIGGNGDDEAGSYRSDPPFQVAREAIGLGFGRSTLRFKGAFSPRLGVGVNVVCAVSHNGTQETRDELTLKPARSDITPARVGKFVMVSSGNAVTGWTREASWPRR